MRSVDQETANFISLDKVVHFAMYFSLTFLWMIDLIKQYHFKSFRYYANKVSLIFSVLLGLILELIQLKLLPERSFDYYDILANTLGAVGALIFFRIIYGKIKYYTS